MYRVCFSIKLFFLVCLGVAAVILLCLLVFSTSEALVAGPLIQRTSSEREWLAATEHYHDLHSDDDHETYPVVTELVQGMPEK